MQNYSFTNVLEYIPKKYVGLSSKQMQDRQAVYSFKDGNCPQYVKEQVLDRIQRKIAGNPSSWVVCFIPASTKQKHIRRYSALASYLNSNLGCEVRIDGIDVAYDKDSGHMTGKTGNPTENMRFNPEVFSGKRVILVDDVRTRGTTFTMTADKMSALGAVTVFGVFVAQTIHPDLPIDTTPHPRGGWYDEAINDMLADQMYEEEMAAEAMADMMYEEEMQAELMAECMWDDDPGLYM
jgi:pyrimidine operon attenuation protein/uracil phosphoribosyltransferase